MERDRGGSAARGRQDPEQAQLRLDSHSHEKPKVLVVYIGQASLHNFHVGREWGIWGFKESNPDYEQINVGDFILFGLGFTGRGPRIPLGEWILDSMGEVVVGRVTEAPYHDTKPFWPDEHTPAPTACALRK